MYWNISSAIAFIFRDMININMRCIEMTVREIILDLCNGLTLTWDVLKYDVDVEKLTDGVD